MRAIGFCNPTNTLEGQTWDIDRFTSVFHNFCDTLAHQPAAIITPDTPAQSGRTGHGIEKAFEFIRAAEGGFLVVIPDATHIDNELEGVARAAITIENLESEFYCLEESYPDVLQNALINMDAPGVSRKRSLKIRRAMQGRAMQGKSLGKAPYGYDISLEGRFQPNPEESGMVRRIFTLYVEEDLGLRKIVDLLNGEGSRTRRGNSWNIISVRDILRNTSYIGTYMRFGLRLTNNHTPIINPELFRSAQDKARERRQYRGFSDSKPYLLSGLCVCGYCGGRMMGVARTQTWRRLDGTRMSKDYRYYQCQSRSNQGTCGYHTWNTEDLETKVIEKVRQADSSGKLTLSVEGTKGENKRTKAAIERLKNVEESEQRFVKFMRKTASGQSVMKRLKLYLDDLDRSRAEAFISVEPEDVSSLLRNWSDTNFVSQRAFLKEYLDSVTVKDRSVKIHL